MFLSNPRNYFLPAIFLAFLFQACGSSAANENKPIPLTAETNSEFPFSPIEPDVYQGNVVVTTGKLEQKWFIARKGDRWRFDIIEANAPAFTQLRADKLYYIDHRRRIYAITDATPAASAPIDDLTANIFRGKEYHEFDDLGRDGGLHKYKVRQPDPSKGEVLIYIDETSNLIVKQEYSSSKTEAMQSSYIYEIRDLKLEADDSLFTLPTGYRKASWDEYRGTKTKPSK
ncbi:hypothetical protein BH10ACI3_BH10ACI3_27970 [soil metagenome]